MGYYSNNKTTAAIAWELEAWGCDMKTFCYPGTKRLDDRAIIIANKSLQTLQNEITDVNDWNNISRPIGPYAEHKEFDNSISYEKPLSNNDAISDKKENGDLK